MSKAPHLLRTRFTEALSAMYKAEVVQYVSLCDLATSVNNAEVLSSTPLNDPQLEYERHGAIRLGSAHELSMLRRLFAVMGMYPVDYYDLSVAGIPVHSTAFRPTDLEALKESPFRVFTSLLRLELIEDTALQDRAEKILSMRQIFSPQLIEIIECFEIQNQLDESQADIFIKESVEVFRWHQDALVDSKTYQSLNLAHRLVADVVSFKGPHINHLTRHCLNIDELQLRLSDSTYGFKAKAVIEGPPFRKCPILLRQTSFLALDEKVTFIDAVVGTHTARFGEIEQRGVALTPKGRKLYDKLLSNARRNKNENSTFTESLEQEFIPFPDDHRELHDQKLAYYQYSIDRSIYDDMKIDEPGLNELLDNHIIKIMPILYEDFLPVSAAGIFASNLAASKEDHADIKQNPNKASFEKALGCSVINSFTLYEKIQSDSLDLVLSALK